MILLFEFILVGVISDLGLFRQYQVRFPFSSLVSLPTGFMILHASGSFMSMGKGVLLFQLLYLAACIDSITLEIPDWVHLLILSVGLIQLHLPDSVIGLFLISMPFLIFSRLTGNSIGAGDVKFMAAYGFVLGSGGIVIAATVGMILASIYNVPLLLHRNHHRVESAMAPSLAAGCLFSYLLLN